MRENRTHGSMRRREAENDQSAKSVQSMKPPADPTYGPDEMFISPQPLC